MDQLNCGAMLVTRSGVVAYANSRLAELFARPAEKLVGLDLREFYAADEAREQITARLERFDEPAEYEFHIPRADGTEVPVIATERRLAGNGLDKMPKREPERAVQDRVTPKQVVRSMDRIPAVCRETLSTASA